MTRSIAGRWRRWPWFCTHTPNTESICFERVEIDAGDTYAYDERALLDQAQREALAASRIFGLLNTPETAEFNGLWREFEGRLTPEARFARALDRLQPLLHNYCTEGEVWRRNALRASPVRKAMQVIGEGSSTLGAFADRLIAAADAAAAPRCGIGSLRSSVSSISTAHRITSRIPPLS
jgi:hypothetical protein